MKKKAKTQSAPSGQKPEKKGGIGSLIINIILVGILLAGLGIFLYPTFSDMWNTWRESKLISGYSKTVADTSKDELQKYWDGAKAYNDQHTQNIIVDAFRKDAYIETHPYDDLLNPNHDGVMGYLEVPKIGQKLAISHGTGAAVLEHGVGHVQGTSLPIGGEGTHAVLAGHRGLPSAKLFTDLDQIQVGDMFFLYILDQTLAYQVDQIKVVLPSEVQYLDIVPGRDLVTLVTCTPYGVNTHRILVRGSRVPYHPADVKKQAAQAQFSNTALAHRLLIIGLIVLAVFLLFLFLFAGRRKSKKEEQPQEENHQETSESGEEPGQHDGD